jgi:hypothetical protein
MSTMYIRVRKDGTIYDYNEILAKNPDCEVIPEEIAFPERFIPEAAKTKPRRKSALDLATADIPEPPVYTSSELAAEAAHGMP